MTSASISIITDVQSSDMGYTDPMADFKRAYISETYESEKHNPSERNERVCKIFNDALRQKGGASGWWKDPIINNFLTSFIPQEQEALAEVLYGKGGGYDLVNAVYESAGLGLVPELTYLIGKAKDKLKDRAFGEQVNINVALRYAAKGGHIDAIKALSPDKKLDIYAVMEILSGAAHTGKVNVISYTLEHYADVVMSAPLRESFSWETSAPEAYSVSIANDMLRKACESDAASDVIRLLSTQPGGLSLPSTDDINREFSGSYWSINLMRAFLGSEGMRPYQQTIIDQYKNVVATEKRHGFNKEEILALLAPYVPEDIRQEQEEILQQQRVLEHESEERRAASGRGGFKFNPFNPLTVLADEVLAPPALPLREFIQKVFQDGDTYTVDAVDGKAQQVWAIENSDALGAFIQGGRTDHYSMDLMRPKSAATDHVEKSITVTYEIVRKDYQWFDLRLKRYTVDRAEKIRKDQALREEQDAAYRAAAGSGAASSDIESDQQVKGTQEVVSVKMTREELAEYNANRLEKRPTESESSMTAQTKVADLNANMSVETESSDAWDVGIDREKRREQARIAKERALKAVEERAEKFRDCQESNDTTK
jgi:hypothetical protein